MRAARNALLGISGVVAVLPGVDALTKAISVPSESAKLFGATATVASALIVGLMWVSREKLGSPHNLASLQNKLLVAAGSALVAYTVLFAVKVFVPEPGYEFLLPLWYGPHFEELLQLKDGSVEEVFRTYGADDLRGVLNEQPIAVACSLLSLLALYLGFLCTIVANLTLLAVRVDRAQSP